MAANNTIKVKQIDNTELLAFLQNSLGLTIAGTSTSHAYTESFNNDINITATLSVSGTSLFGQQATFNKGLVSNSGVYVNGLISGKAAAFDTFSLKSGSIGNFTLGTAIFTGVPIYESGSAGVAVLLPSGTVFGLRQQINAPLFEKDVNGDLMPTTGVGVSLIMLCVSMGS